MISQRPHDHRHTTRPEGPPRTAARRMSVLARLRRAYAAQVELHERMWQEHQPWRQDETGAARQALSSW